MKNKLYLLTACCLSSCLLMGCFNMPTQSSQITGVYISPSKYKDSNCDDLSIEAGNLARRENALVIAQEQRYKNSQTQAFWYGFGQGDGIEATELANVRGEKMPS